MRTVSNPVPEWIVVSDGTIAKSGLLGEDLSLVMAYKIAATLAWVFETDFNAAQFDDFIESVGRTWHKRIDRDHLLTDYVHSFDQLRGYEPETAAAQAWRRERRDLVRNRGYKAKGGKDSEALSWAGRLDSASHQTLAQWPRPLTRQAALCFVEAALVFGRVMVHGTDQWRPLNSDYNVALVRVVGAWQKLSAESVETTLRATSDWPAILWDGRSISSWYTQFWLHDVAADLASELVPGFDAWRPHGAREFIDYLHKAQEAEEARREAERRRTARARVQRVAALATQADSGNRPWVNSVIAQSTYNSNNMINIYNQQLATIRNGYGSPYTYKW